VKEAVEEIRKLPNLCCMGEIRQTTTLYDYTFQDVQKTLSIAMRIGDCFLCDHFVLKIDTGSRSRLVARQVIRFLDTPRPYNWMEVKPHQVLYQMQTHFAEPTKYVPLEDGSVIIFSDEGILFRLDRNGRSKFVDQSENLLQIEIPLREDVKRYGSKEPYVGENFPNADPIIETNCTFVPVYRAYNKFRAKQGKRPWRFTLYPGCGDPNR
jgi:hypothetical protein